MKELSIDYRNAIDQIIDIICCKKYMYGSSKYGIMAYYAEQYDVKVYTAKKYGITNNIFYEICHPKFSILYESVWPQKDRCWRWNNEQIDPNKSQSVTEYIDYCKRYNAGGDVTVLYDGDADTIQEIAMWVWLSSSIGIEVD